MRRKEMADLVRRYTRRLEALARRIAAGYNEEDIHAFRIVVKKLRAFIRLAGPTADPIRLPKSLRIFYHAIGSIRNLQLQLDCLTKLKTVGHEDFVQPLIDRLGEELIVAKHSLGPLLLRGRHPFGNLDTKLISGLPPRLGQVHRHRFLTSHLDVLNPATFPQLPDDQRLHTLRKSIKDLLYTWPWLGNHGRKLAAAPLGGHKCLKKAGALLGEYLDNRLKLRLLIGREAGTHAFYARLRDDWAEEKASLRRRIDHSLGRKLHFTTQPHVKPADKILNPLSGNTSSLSNELHLE